MGTGAGTGTDGAGAGGGGSDGAGTSTGTGAGTGTGADVPTAPGVAAMSVEQALANPAAFFAGCGQPLTLDGDLLFDLNDDGLRPQSVPTLQKLRRLLRSAGRKDLELQVVGHADPRGTERYNEGLSARRARRVARWLVAHGAVKAKRVQSEGRGEREPVVTDPAAPDSEHRKNRRVEIVVPCREEP